jgi:hypothetical protein
MLLASTALAQEDSARDSTQPAPVRLVFNTTPASASISVNGVLLGVTPLKLDTSYTGEYKVDLALEGYRPFSRTFSFPTGTHKKVSITLGKDCPSAKIQSTPPAAVATLDGATVGTTPLVIRDFRPGVHALKLTLSGYAPYRTNLMLDESTCDRFSFTLMTNAAADSMKKVQKRQTKLLTQVLLGSATLLFTSITGYQHWSLMSAREDQDAAYSRYDQSNLSQDQYDQYWAAYRTTVRTSDDIMRRRNALGTVALLFAAGLSVTFLF